MTDYTDQLKEARSKFKNVSLALFRDSLKNNSKIEKGIPLIDSEGKSINIPIKNIGWDYDTIKGIKMMHINDSDTEDIFICVALDNVTVIKHKHDETEIVKMISGEAFEHVLGVTVTDSLTIPAQQYHEFEFKKGCIFTVTFIPKLVQ